MVNPKLINRKLGGYECPKCGQYSTGHHETLVGAKNKSHFRCPYCGYGMTKSQKTRVSGML